jgi:flavin-dependent dehydrogenase
MSKARAHADVVVLGSHPCCAFAASLLAEQGVPCALANIPGEISPDRLILINPKFFELHKLTGAIKKNVDLTPIYGLKFLADDEHIESEFVAKSVAGYIACFSEFSRALMEQAKRAKVEIIDSKTLDVCGADEQGVHLSINGVEKNPKMLIVGGQLPDPARRVLGLHESWEHGVMHRYTFLRLDGAKWIDQKEKQTIPMSLDLAGKLLWAWLLPGKDEVQIAVEQGIDSIASLPPARLLAMWINVLTKHRVLKPGPKPIAIDAAQSIDLPFAGALSQEGVANRTLLIGPAGGFYTASAEDMYPNCWSAMFAVDVAKQALGQKHLQDALGAYRETWGATLGDYLRGPQENLRFLLPLVYRNPVMTARMGEAILLGTSVVR